MTLRQLETLYWVYRLGSFAAAAERMHSTQSAVSMRVRDLEASLGVALFDRSLRSARLTVKGRDLVRYAERVLQLVAEIRDRVGDPRAVTGAIRIGVTELVALTWLSDLVTAINEHYPGVEVELNVDSQLNHIERLQNDELDVVLMPGPVSMPGLGRVPCGSVELAWMASPKLGIPKRTLSPRDLQQWPLLTMTRSSNLHRLLNDWFAQSGVVARGADTCNSIATLASFTLAGMGVSFLPRRHFEKEIREGRLQVLRTMPLLPNLEYFAFYDSRPTHLLAAAVAQLAQQCSTFAKRAKVQPRPTAMAAREAPARTGARSHR